MISSFFKVTTLLLCVPNQNLIPRSLLTRSHKISNDPSPKTKSVSDYHICPIQHAMVNLEPAKRHSKEPVEFGAISLNLNSTGC